MGGRCDAGMSAGKSLMKLSPCIGSGDHVKASMAARFSQPVKMIAHAPKTGLDVSAIHTHALTQMIIEPDFGRCKVGCVGQGRAGLDPARDAIVGRLEGALPAALAASPGFRYLAADKKAPPMPGLFAFSGLGRV